MTLHNVAEIKSERSLTKRTKLSCTALSHQQNFKSLRHWNSIQPCTEERASGPLWLLQNRHALCFVLSFPKTTGTIGLRSIFLFTVPKIRFLNNNYSDTLMKMLPNNSWMISNEHTGINHTFGRFSPFTFSCRHPEEATDLFVFSVLSTPDSFPSILRTA